MEDEKRIVLNYEGNTAETMDWAQGIGVHQASLKKGKKKAAKPLSADVQRHFVSGVMFCIIGIAVLMAWRTSPAVGIPIAIFEITLAAVHLLFGFSLKKVLSRIRKAYQEAHAGGELIFDSFGIEDREVSGKTVRLSWSEYELCVITHQVVVLLCGGILYAAPYTDEICEQIVQALDTFGKAHTVLDCR